MGYHVAIIRTREGIQEIITVEDVATAVAGLPEFRLETDVRGETIVEFPECGDPPPCVWFTDGEIWTKNPDERTIDVMCHLAGLLGARVRGDELETYRSSSEIYLHPDDSGQREAADRSRADLMRRSKKGSFRLQLCIAAVCLTLGVLAGKCSQLEPVAPEAGGDPSHGR